MLVVSVIFAEDIQIPSPTPEAPTTCKPVLLPHIPYLFDLNVRLVFPCCTCSVLCILHTPGMFTSVFLVLRLLWQVKMMDGGHEICGLCVAKSS